MIHSFFFKPPVLPSPTDNFVDEFIGFAPCKNGTAVIATEDTFYAMDGDGLHWRAVSYNADVENDSWDLMGESAGHWIIRRERVPNPQTDPLTTEFEYDSLGLDGVPRKIYKWRWHGAVGLVHQSFFSDEVSAYNDRTDLMITLDGGTHWTRNANILFGDDPSVYCYCIAWISSNNLIVSGNGTLSDYKVDGQGKISQVWQQKSGDMDSREIYFEPKTSLVWTDSGLGVRLTDGIVTGVIKSKLLTGMDGLKSHHIFVSNGNYYIFGIGGVEDWDVSGESPKRVAAFTHGMDGQTVTGSFIFAMPGKDGVGMVTLDTQNKLFTWDGSSDHLDPAELHVDNSLVDKVRGVGVEVPKSNGLPQRTR